MNNLVLTDYRINELDVVRSGDEATLLPMGAGGKGKSQKKKSLKEIITKINSIWGEEVSAVTGAQAINAIADKVAADEISRIQIQNSTNSKEAVIADGRLESSVLQAALSLINNDFKDLAEKVMNDPQALTPMTEIVYDLILKRKHLDITALTEFIKESRNQ